MTKATSILQSMGRDLLDRPQVAPEKYAFDGTLLEPDKLEGYRDKRIYTGTPEQHQADFLNATVIA